MKRNTHDHWKFADLSEALGIPKYAAAGILEMLWHMTARYAPAGNIGVCSNRAIAKWIGWSGSPDELVNALVQAEWLDEDETHRLLVHDWADHADQTVKRHLGRQKLVFAQPGTKLCLTIDRPPMPMPLKKKKKKLEEEEENPQKKKKKKLAARPPTADEPLPENTVLTFPCVPGKGQAGKEIVYHLTKDKLNEYVECYPTIDALAGLRRCLQWCRDNPGKRKTHGGIEKLFNHWLTKETNSGRYAEQTQGTGKSAGDMLRETQA